MLKRDRRTRLEPVSGILAGVLDRLGLSGQLREFRAVTLWAEVAGEPVCRHTEAFTIEDGRLTVFVDSHTWLQELQFLRPEIIARLNAALGADIVKDIHFALSSRRRQ